MKNTVLFFLIVLKAFTSCAQSLPQTMRRTLAQDTAIQGYPCTKGYAWLYRDGSLNRCTVARETAFGEAQIPAGSIIELLPNGTTHYVLLAHNANVLGYSAMGGGVLGPGEGAVTSFYPDGKLRSVYLVGDRTIHGVPCRGAQWGILTDPVNGGNYVEFYEDGRLRSCKLTQDDGGQKSGQRLILPH